MEYIGQLASPRGLGSRLWWHVRDHFVPHSRNHYAPHLLHHRTLVWFSVLLLAIKIASVSLLLQLEPTGPVVASAITQTSVFELTNQARTESNLGQLTYNKTLEQAAQAKANDMLARQYFAHTTPDGKSPWYFFDLAGYKYLSAGENLAVHFSDVEPLQDAWMNSPGHRANILNSVFREMGVGIAKGQFEGHESIFVVEEFGNPAVVESKTLVPTAVVRPQAASAAPVVVNSAATEQPPTTPKRQTVTQTAPITQQQPIALAEQKTITRQAVDVPEPLSIGPASVSLSGGQVSVTTTTSGNVAKLLLAYGEKAQFFKLGSDGKWSVSLPLSAVGSETLTIEAFDLQGRMAVSHVASISPNFAASHASLSNGSVKAASIIVLGQQIPLQVLEHKAYLAIIALVLTALVIAIAVHRHLQHIRLVANGAFVVAFAALLLLF